MCAGQDPGPFAVLDGIKEEVLGSALCQFVPLTDVALMGDASNLTFACAKGVKLLLTVAIQDQLTMKVQKFKTSC